VLAVSGIQSQELINDVLNWVPEKLDQGMALAINKVKATSTVKH
jgi:hypothetical protein